MTAAPAMTGLLWLAPLFLVFEVWQLIACERQLGVKRIREGLDAGDLRVGEGTAFWWTLLIFAYWLWMGMILVGPARVQAAALVVVSLAGFTLRRHCPLKWTLVILTFEGAIRIGMLVSIGALLWRTLR